MQTYATPAPIRTLLQIPAGRVQFIATDRAETTVEIRPADPGKSRDQKAAARTTAEFADGTLRIRTDEPAHPRLGPTGAIEVTVQVPAGSHLKAETAACEVRVVGRMGEIAFDGAHRHIKIDEAAALELTAVDGDVEVGRLTGPARITTARGAIRVAEAARGTLELSTQSGDITVGAIPGSSATLEATTLHGRVHNTLRNSAATPDLAIHASTNNGDITAHTLEK
ncbi:DUF4097 family beta strand repeat-containing protein [Actinospica robiniae]|uniref:DUF4097 family beta strand repeat-containing protein n=1 Tax=Actinospica robiniae TaxID=304901 RepID=UPI000400C794|nr:DUF4097 family beta strand repeat-containing protein [Actinospica robiniae]